jgi:hypothetical protein
VDLIQFLTADVFNWCSIRCVLLPADVPEAMWHLLDVLVATDALDHDSDPLDELRKPLRCYGGLDGSGRDGPTTTAGPSSGASATSLTDGRCIASFEPTQLEPAVRDGRDRPGPAVRREWDWMFPLVSDDWGSNVGSNGPGVCPNGHVSSARCSPGRPLVLVAGASRQGGTKAPGRVPGTGCTSSK